VSLSFTSAHQKERALLLLQIEASPRDAKTLEDECVTILKTSLLSTEGEAWHRLDGTLKELNGLIKGLMVSQTIDDVHAIVAILDTEAVLHVSHAGRGEGYLLRGANASQITEYSRGKPVPMFIHISSGGLEPGDTVVLSTQRLLRSFTPAQLLHLNSRGDQILDDIAVQLDGERELSSLGVVHMAGPVERSVRRPLEVEEDIPVRRSSPPPRRGSSRGRMNIMQFSGPFLDAVGPLMEKAKAVLSGVAKTSASIGRKSASAGVKVGAKVGRKSVTRLSGVSAGIQGLQTAFARFLVDLRHPERKRRAHLLLLASVVAAFLIIWLVVRLSTSSQRNKTKAELGELVEQISMEIRTADNRHLTGDLDSANAILAKAEENAKKVMDSESGLFRLEALNLLDRIHAKKEEINNIVRLSPRVVVNVASQNADVSAQGLVGITEGEFIIYDRQNSYHVLLNGVDEGKRIADQELVIAGASFPRYKSQVFLTTGNSVIELLGNAPTSMKTEDPAGWVSGKDVQTYLRYLYVLSEKHIYKYERLSNRYGSPVQYDVNADLAGSLDMAIDGSVFVLKQNGVVLKLLRGEAQKFGLIHAPDQVLKDASKFYKVADGNFYFLDPVRNRVIVSTDGGATGESNYVKQYVLEGDQLGKLQDLYVDPEEAHLYVMDEKRLYVVDLANR